MWTSRGLILSRYWLVLAMLMAWAGSAQAAYYYRWSGSPTYTCVDDGGGKVRVNISNRSVEWHLPASGAQLTGNYITNGSENSVGPSNLAGGDGSNNFATLSMGPATLPAVVEVRYTTTANGKITYNSTMTARCAAAGESGSVTVTNVAAMGATTNYQDWWWNPTLDGMGINIAHQGNAMAVVWYMYDDDNTGAYLIMSGFTSGNALSGDLYRGTGPAPGLAFDPADVHFTAVGTGSIQFLTGNSAKFTYNYGGKSGTLYLNRLNFNVPDRAGTWGVAIKASASGCTNPAGNISWVDAGALETLMDGNVLVMHLTYLNGVRCDYSYLPDQVGAYATGSGTFVCTNGLAGVATFDNLRLGDGFLTMDYEAQVTTGETCLVAGKIAGFK